MNLIMKNLMIDFVEQVDGAISYYCCNGKDY
jgi:hypothetical protein